jgi:hypothetical protein
MLSSKGPIKSVIGANRCPRQTPWAQLARYIAIADVRYGPIADEQIQHRGLNVTLGQKRTSRRQRRGLCNQFSIAPPATNRKMVRTKATAKSGQAARPHNTPKDAVIQIVAAVESPCTICPSLPRCTIRPAPKNPTPVITPWITLLASAGEYFATAKTATADARETRPSVRIPVGF